MNPVALGPTLGPTLRSLVGVPYLDRGRSLAGADCYGIVQLAHALLLGNRLPGYLALYESADDPAAAALALLRGRGRDRDGGWTRLADVVDCASRKRASDEVRAMGDVVLLRVGGLPSHCGMMTGNGMEFLHTLRGRNSCLEALDGLVWRDRIEGTWRWTS